MRIFVYLRQFCLVSVIAGAEDVVAIQVPGAVLDVARDYLLAHCDNAAAKTMYLTAVTVASDRVSTTARDYYFRMSLHAFHEERLVPVWVTVAQYDPEVGVKDLYEVTEFREAGLNCR